MTAPPLPSDIEAHSDDELVERVVEGEVRSFAVLMRRHTGRLFRLVRAIVQYDADAEDACRDAWLRAYRHLADLRHGTPFSRWVARIALRCALERRRTRDPIESLDDLDEGHVDLVASDPDGPAHGRGLVRRVERALDELAPSYRTILVLRDFERMTTTETAAVLGLTEENVRVRLHRARACLRQRLDDDLGGEVEHAFRFDGDRRARLTRAVMATLVDEPHDDWRCATRSERVGSPSPRPSNVS